MPPVDPTDAILGALGQSTLLDPTRLAELTGWVAQTRPDPQTLARELTRRGWLTPFQVKELYKGRARDLFIGPYVLLDLLGEGGMGRVYKARHTRLGREEALKVIRKEKLSNPIAVARFQHEIRAAGQLSHPNVVVAFDSDSANGVHFFSMEYVEGTDLTKWVREHGAMPVPLACDAIRQAALGLQHAHEKGLVHRDIKPSNILLTPRGQVKLLDLGLAMLHESVLAGGENANRVTQEGYVLGTPDFLAPEQAQNPTKVDIRADIYGLGATLFYLLTARVPFEGANATEKLLKHITEVPPLVTMFRPDAPPQLDQLIHWLMAKRPEDRPQTPAAVAMALAPFCPAQSGVYAHPSTLPAPVYPTALPTFPPSGTFSPAAAAYPAAVPAPGFPAAVPVTFPSAVPVEDLQFNKNAPAPAFADFDVTEDEDEETDRPGKSDREKPKKKPRAAADGTKAVRVKAPKQRSNLPLILIGIFGALILFCLGSGYMIYFYVDRSIKDNRPLDQEFFNSAGVKMLKVEPGTFMMGSPEGETEREEQEGPQREVTLTQPFYMSQTEITRKQYLEVVSNVPGLLKVQVTGKVRQSMPVEGISYDEAVEYCKKLTLKESKTDRHRPGWEYRLPTEAEWEYVARAGSETPFARFEDGGTGDTITMIKHAVFDFNIDDPYMQLPPDFKAKTRMPYPAFSSQEEATSLNFADKYRHPNRWGFYDMHGNVYEWVRDFYSGKYPEGPATDPTGPATGTYRVIRGGAWTEPAGKCRSAAREGREASTKSSDIGFRIVYAKKPENP